VADWVFGTCIVPRTVYADGEPSDPEMFRHPKPIAPIAWLDAWAKRSMQARRSRIAADVETELTRPDDEVASKRMEAAHPSRTKP
jgi:hypothetical protein